MGREERRRARRVAAGWAALLALIAAAAQAGCVLPVRHASGARGQLLDAETGRPVAGALVVVRFEGWYDDALPDRDLLGHREVRSGPDGRFETGSLTRAGLSAWPLLQTEARVVGVLADGYRCPPPRRLRRQTRLRLEPALDAADRRASCRAVSVGPGQASAYMEGWRRLFRVEDTAEERRRQRDLERLLAARAAFGYGQNCVGPVVDLALDPSGRRAALVAAGGGSSELRVLDLRETGRSERLELEVLAHQRLAWTPAAELVLWEPSTRRRKALSGSILGNAAFQVVWTPPGGRSAPALPISGGSGPSRPLEPADLNDEGDARWMGRSFETRRDVDPRTGLGRDVLVVTTPDGRSRPIDLPGETCGPAGRFGRPHYRITEDGRSGLDLRFVGGGCHALRIDLETGDWARLDGARGPARCRLVRSVPAQHMHGALRGYMRDVREALEEAGADPTTAYALHVDPAGPTRAVTRDLKGGKHTVEVPAFPLTTPLRRIEVTVAGGRSPAPESRALPPPAEVQPSPEEEAQPPASPVPL